MVTFSGNYEGCEMVDAITEEAIKKRKIKEQKHILFEALNEPWASVIFEASFNRKVVHHYSEFYHKWKGANPKTVTDRLNKLCDIGILIKKENVIEKKKGRGKKETEYVFSIQKQKMEKYISKFHDLKLIQDCPIDYIHSLTFPYDTDDKKWEIAAIGVTVYGLEQRNPQIEAILESAYKKLKKYLNSTYRQKIISIVLKECKHIRQYKLKQSVKEWGSIISKDIFLNQAVHSLEPKYSRPIYKAPEKFEQEFKEITEKIWSQFNKDCPPIGIMIEFSTRFKLRMLTPDSSR